MLLRAARIITGRDEDPIPSGLIRIEEGIITAVGRAEEFGEVNESVVEVEGTLLPGLVDSHAHPTLPSDGRPLSVQATAPSELSVLVGVRQLQRHLAAGYTAVMDCGAKGRAGLSLRDAAAIGLIKSPRLLAVGRPITPSQGHMSWCGSVADGPDEIRREIAILSSAGADAIKIIASGGGTGGIPTRPSYDTASLAAAVAAAHDQGLRVIAHCRATEAIARCAEVGVDVIAHVEFLKPGPVADLGGGAPTALPSYDSRVAEAVAASNAFVDLNPHSSGWDTLLSLRQRAESEALEEGEQRAKQGLERYFEAMLAVIHELAQLGLTDRMCFGSDAGPFDTEFGHPEYNVHLARLAGLSALESIQVITRNAARSIGLTDAGTIEAGKRADLVALRGDPTEDPGCVASPQVIFLAGVPVSTATPPAEALQPSTPT